MFILELDPRAAMYVARQEPRLGQPAAESTYIHCSARVINIKELKLATQSVVHLSAVLALLYRGDPAASMAEGPHSRLRVSGALGVREFAVRAVLQPHMFDETQKALAMGRTVRVAASWTDSKGKWAESDGPEPITWDGGATCLWDDGRMPTVPIRDLVVDFPLIANSDQSADQHGEAFGSDDAVAAAQSLTAAVADVQRAVETAQVKVIAAIMRLAWIIAVIVVALALIKR